MNITGGCQCGAVRFRAESLGEASICHCRMCQKATGGLFGPYATVKAAELVWTRGERARFQSSNKVWRGFCQACGTPNPADQDICARCHQKLLIVSGAPGEEAEDLARDRDADFSLDEHLLERVSILEEAVKRTAETVQRLVEALHKQEKNLLVSQTGFGTLRELLERRRLIGREEWADLWQAKMDYQLKALEKRRMRKNTTHWRRLHCTAEASSARVPSRVANTLVQLPASPTSSTQRVESSVAGALV